MYMKLGADPEVFVSRLGKLASGFGLIKGNKDNPHPVEKGAVQVDGMALEFNIDPAESEEAFLENIEVVLAQMKAMVPDYDLEIIPTAHFGEEMIEAQPLEAKALGCEPDLNAYTFAENPTPDGSLGFRTGAGHVHVGWDDNAEDAEDHADYCAAMAKQLDLYLGLPSLLFDADTERRELYGKAGAYREKSYGMEYRTLSNVWVSSPELTKWVYRASRKAVEDLFNGHCPFVKYGEELATIINTSDIERAKEIIAIENLEIPNVLG